MSKSKVLPTHGAILRQIAINSASFNMLKFHQQKHQTKKYMLIQIGLYDSTSTSKLLLSFVRLTYLKKKKRRLDVLLLARCFFVKLGQILDQVAYRELEESSPQTWLKKDGLRPEDLLDESAGVQKSPLNKQTAGGVLTLLTSASFFSCSIQQL